MSEQYKVEYPESDRIAKAWFIFAVIWLPIFAFFGGILAIKFFLPDFLGGEEWLTFGRIRPGHVNGVLFGFLSSGLLGTMFWIVPRLCAAPIYRPRLAMATPFLWNGAVIAGIIWILLGGSQGREYAELPWAIDVAVMVTLVLMAYIIIGTIIHRTERKLYVSLWYYAGTLLWFPVIYFVGNVMWHEPTGALNGTVDAIFNWYYGHNVLGLWFTTLGIPAWYYFIPRMINRPLYSHLLSLIAFFTIAFFYTGVGAHHLLQAPIPPWLVTVAVVLSVLMAVPVIVFATNILLTMRGSWHRLRGNISMQFMMAAFFMYVLVSLQGSFQALRSTNMFLHFSQWTVGHAHLALLGGFGFLVIGLAFWLVPRMSGVRVFSQNLMRLTFWVALIGFIFFFLAMTVAGLVANSNWWQHINPLETLFTLRPHFIWRALAGGVVFVAFVLFSYNILMTVLRARHPHVEESIEGVGQTQSPKPHSPFMRRSQEELSLPTVAVGGMTVFTIMTFMVIAMPYMFANNTPTALAHPLQGPEYEGEQLYRSLGCFYCHSQFVRPQDWAMGNVSQSGDFYYSVPNFLGTERTGPNLGQIGGKKPTEWLTEHYVDPRSLYPTSIMPPFAFLTTEQMDDLAAYLQNLGTEDLATGNFQPPLPYDYQDKQSPYRSLISEVDQFYDPETETYTGNQSLNGEWTSLFDEAKILYVQKCMQCHGGSGNGQGPYARNILAKPANLHDRIADYPEPVDAYHFWRTSAGVAGTAMPPWERSLTEDTIWQINTYENSFVDGARRTVSPVIPAQEALEFAQETNITPPIGGTQQDYQTGMQLYNLYCAQCHGTNGQGDGPASITQPGGYINPPPFNLTVAGLTFQDYGQYVWMVQQGVETTNMPPWRYALSDDEIYQVIFYVQSFSSAEDYNSKWAPQYVDDFARELKN
jgi:cbb3-type cytochrome c oxidase subunit I/cbb3-type cytochrome c oxidase subunit II